MAVDPRALKTFLAVCRTGSISAAARQLCLTQPAVSATMLQLEQGLQTRLFDRKRSGIMLTSSGVALRTRAEAMEAILQSAEREIALLKDNVSGPLTVGGTPGALASLIPTTIALLKDRYPAFELQVLERSDRQLADLLRSERIDLAVVSTGIDPVAEDFIEETFLSDTFALLVGPANDHLPEQLALASLADARWVLPHAEGAFRRQVDTLFLATGTRTPANVIRCDSLLTTKALVRRTDYLTILPHEVAAAELASGAIRSIEILGSQLVRKVGVRMLKRKLPSPILEALLSCMRDAAQR
ncbi:LysR family transcriptional regulator [Sphingosinicella sp. BN140058]|uniref:LysR family transcriptional regulator n=1 Tax=Sphingosinicella sp. BN140058 TaxID=1892855 RepID=UPI0010130E04|nr:LysR family transcriptional regulator [Sphingosinicella sp. BN140058]QAY78105.1 LysR family transcriptional regulator [Sphingosinicella sp. BN140058]